MSCSLLYNCFPVTWLSETDVQASHQKVLIMNITGVVISHYAILSYRLFIPVLSYHTTLQLNPGNIVGFMG